MDAWGLPAFDIAFRVVSFAAGFFRADRIYNGILALGFLLYLGFRKGDERGEKMKRRLMEQFCAWIERGQAELLLTALDTGCQDRWLNGLLKMYLDGRFPNDFYEVREEGTEESIKAQLAEYMRGKAWGGENTDREVFGWEITRSVYYKRTNVFFSRIRIDFFLILL